MRAVAAISLFLFGSPLLAQAPAKAAPPGVFNVLDCVNSLKDQDGGGCIEASSSATFGVLFPYPGAFNTFTAPAVVSGGSLNAAAEPYSTVSGGFLNTAFYSFSTVSGGNSNLAYGVSATVSGGNSNVARSYATVSGGANNLADGSGSTIAGGISNRAQGYASFAAGSSAAALHTGAFVWGDSSSSLDKTSSADDQFNIYAEGGMRMFADGQTTPSLEVDPGGRVGIGAVSSSFPLSIQANGSGNSIQLVTSQGGSSYHLDFGSDHLQFVESGVATDRFVLRDGGNVGIGTTTPSFKLEVDGSAGKPGGGSWSISSDRRLKKNIKDLEGALATLLALRGRTFEYKDPESINEFAGERIGFIAQEVEAVLPDWVGEKPDGMKMLTVRGFEALAVEALRELDEAGQAKDAEIARVREENAELRSRVEELETIEEKLAKLEATVAMMAEQD